jgi:hypothetical protein
LKCTRNEKSICHPGWEGDVDSDQERRGAGRLA